MVFWTSFSCLSKVAHFKQNDSCVERLDTNFKQQDGFARSSGEVLACYQKTQSSSKTTVAQSALTPMSSNRSVAHGLLDRF